MQVSALKSQRTGEIEATKHEANNDFDDRQMDILVSQ